MPGLTTVTPDFPTSFVSDSTTYNEGSINSVTVARPADVVSGDFLLAVVYTNIGLVNISAPGGWSTVFTGGGLSSFKIFRRVIGGAEPASYTFTYSNSDSKRVRGNIVAYRGETTSNTVGTQLASSGTTATAPSITPTLNGTLLGIYVNAGGADSQPNPITDPILMNQKVAHGFGEGGLGFYLYDKYPSAAFSASGDKSITFPVSVGCQSMLVQIA